MGWYPERYASGDIQTTTMTLHIANKAGGATLGAEIFFNVKYSTSEEEKNCHMANKVEETLATKIFFCGKSLMYNSCRMYKKYIVHMLVKNAKLYNTLQYCTSLCMERVEEVHCKCGGMELEAWGLQSPSSSPPRTHTSQIQCLPIVQDSNY